MQSQGDRVVDEAVRQAFGPHQPDPQQMAMARAMVDPFEGLPVMPEPCKWDAQTATMPAHEQPVIDEETGQPRTNEDGSVMTEVIPAHHMGIVRIIYPNHIAKVWLNRDAIRQFKKFLTELDDMLREQETGLSTSTTRSKLIVPGQ